MLIEATEQRLVVVSDLHIGNPFSRASQTVPLLFERLKEERWNLCINGDGFEILQASFASLAVDSMGILNQIRGLIDSGLRVYYVVGNHDIALEHLLEGACDLQICPFLNIKSGDRRIRIEHGHVYDPFFCTYPDLYELLTRAAGPLLHVYPDVYHLWSRYQGFKDRLRSPRDAEDAEESVYREAAEMLLRRGFDTVVFGHTHTPEMVELGEHGTYVNSGNWMQARSYVQIDCGEVRLRGVD